MGTLGPQRGAEQLCRAGGWGQCTVCPSLCKCRQNQLCFSYPLHHRRHKMPWGRWGTVLDDLSCEEGDKGVQGFSVESAVTTAATEEGRQAV